MEETILVIGETVENTVYDFAVKSETFFEKLLSTVSKELLVLLILAAILVVYFVVNSMKKAKRSLGARKNTVEKRFFKEYAEVELKGFLTRMNGENRAYFLKGAQDYLDKKGYTLSKDSVREMIFDFMKVKDNDAKMKKMYLKGENADFFLDAIYKTLQLGLKTGPEYEKMQAKMKKAFKEQLKKQEFDVSEIENLDFEEMSKHFGETDASFFDQQMQMQMQMAEQMNQQMIEQMNQMNQLMMDQMNMQMMEQMNQMNQQMMDQMNQQMTDQMNQQLNMNLDSMNMANQAITSTDFGGFMDHHAGSGNFGPF